MILFADNAETSVTVTSSQTCNLRYEGKEPCHFAFDQVFDETTSQEQMCEGKHDDEASTFVML